MTSLALDDFWEDYKKLPHEEQERAKEAYARWCADPYYPSLHFKRIKNTEPALWSVRVGDCYRAWGLREDIDGVDTIVWSGIGTHAQYERMIAKF